MRDDLFNITLDNLSGSMMLTIEPKEEVIINEFCCKILKSTNVYGLLKLNVTIINGSIKFNYDLSKKKSIAEYAKAGFNELYGRRILYNLCIAFSKLNEYYLKPNYCLLNPEYTYIGDGLNVYLPCIPIKDIKADGDELKEYFSELLSKYFAVEGIAAYDEMFKYVYQCQTLDLNYFISHFLASEEQNHNNFVAEKKEKLAEKMPLPDQEFPRMEKPQINISNNQPKSVSNIPKEEPKSNIGGFKIPNGGEMKIPNIGSVSQNSEKEKKGLFGFVSKKTVQEQVVPNMPNINVPNQPIQNQNVPQNNFQQNNIPPRMPNGFQGNMDKTIMIDGMNQQSQNVNMGGKIAYLQYRGQNIPINDNEFTIGKANNQFKINFAINNNPHVSRKHATILVQGNSYFIRDEGSTNGTYVNGRSIPKMMPQPLNNGDEISIYDEVFIFCM